ncbi:large-conductance mechanosensitive channel protein MscL [soil metagenome]
MLREFKEFAMRGNVIDMAVGIVIGAAFGRIVSSFVDHLLMPPIGLLTGQVDFSDLYVNLGPGSYPNIEAAREASAPILQYGLFINTLVDFIIIALAIFLVVRAVNRLKRKEPAAPPAPPTTQEKLLAEIRDLLKAGS